MEKTMAKAITAKSNDTFLRFALPDTDPRVFTDWCGVTQKTIKWGRNLEETVVPDCDNPNIVPYVERGATSQSGTIAIQGVITKQALGTYQKLLKSTESLYFQLEMGFGTEKTGWQGKVQLSDFEIVADVGKTVTFSMNMSSDGPIDELETTNNNAGTGNVE